MYDSKPPAAFSFEGLSVFRIEVAHFFGAFLIAFFLIQPTVKAARQSQTNSTQSYSSQLVAEREKGKNGSQWGGQYQPHQLEKHQDPQAPGESSSADHGSASNNQQSTASGPTLRLEDLERMALQGNPTLAQAEAATRAAEGRRVQAGLWPNPIIGYAGEELSTRAFTEKSEHYFFVEQTVLLGGKLKKSRNIFAQEKVQAEQDAVAQKQRILNAVRMLYYEALGAQHLVEVRGRLAKLAREAVGITGELLNVGQADRPDLFQIEIEAQRAQLDLVMAENERDQIWQQLGAVVGNPFLKPVSLEGNLERGLPVLDQGVMLAALLRDSPEMKRAQAGIDRAKAAIARAKAEPIPDLFVRGGIGYSNELLETRDPRLAGRKTGPEAFLEVGVRIPLFNRNQGNIAAASSELEIAEREARRVELTLRARMAAAFRTYQNALRVVTQYEKQVVPHAQRAYDMYFTNFRQMAAAYPQALIAQRTLFQVRADYIRALVDVWETSVQIQGFLLTGGLDAPISTRVEGTAETGERPSSSIEPQGGVK